MKKFFLINVCLLFCVTSCTKQCNDKEIVRYRNYPYPKPLCIDTTNSMFLMNEQFDAKSCDTILLHRLNRETEVEIAKKINEMLNESDVRSGYIVSKLDSNSLYVGNFFLYGKLDLQPNVISLILLRYDEDTLFHSVGKDLWLINIKDDKLYSIVWFDHYTSFIHGEDQGQCFTTITLKNKIFTKTRICTEYFLIDNIGQRKWNSYKLKALAKYRVNTTGYIELVTEDLENEI